MKQSASKIYIDKTISDYNMIASKFSSTRHNITTDLQKLADLVPPNARVLDYGCGNGRMAALFKPDNYLGVDPSKELINIAKELHPNYKFKLINAEERVEEKFDAILCLAVIHHLPDEASHKELIDILHSSLKPEGLLILTAWNLENEPIGPDGLVHKPFKTDSLSIDRALYPFTLKELQDVVDSCGFSLLISQTTPRNRGLYTNIEIVAKYRN